MESWKDYLPHIPGLNGSTGVKAPSPQGSVDPNQTANNPYNFAGPNYGLSTPKPPVEKAYNSDDLKPRTFKSSGGNAGGLNYNVNITSYPEKTAATADLQHYMVFFINLRGASKYVKNNRSVAVTTGGQNRASASGLTTAGVVGVGAGAVGVAAAEIIAGGVGGAIAKTIIVGTAAAAGGGLTKLANDSRGVFKPDQSRRISTAIMLAVNNAPDVKYGITYEGSELGALVGYLAGGSSAADNMFGQPTLELAKIIGLSAAKLPGAVADLFGAQINFGDALQAGTAQAPNPFREQIFRNVQNREFNFKYKFLPRSESEARNVREIIKDFKTNMHPEISNGGQFYIYPSTFDIAYYFNGTENTNLNKISTCVLENMDVDYGGQGWNTFKDGMPTEINLSLKFRELEVLTRERIEKGY